MYANTCQTWHLMKYRHTRERKKKGQPVTGIWYCGTHPTSHPSFTKNSRLLLMFPETGRDCIFEILSGCDLEESFDMVCYTAGNHDMWVRPGSFPREDYPVIVTVRQAGRSMCSLVTVALRKVTIIDLTKARWRSARFADQASRNRGPLRCRWSASAACAIPSTEHAGCSEPRLFVGHVFLENQAQRSRAKDTPAAILLRILLGSGTRLALVPTGADALRKNKASRLVIIL